MNKKSIITTLLALVATTTIVAQDLIKTAMAPISLSKKNFADTIKMGNLQIDNYPMIVEDAMKDYLCGRFDGVLGFNLIGKGLSFKLDTKDSLLIVTDRKKFFS